MTTLAPVRVPVLMYHEIAEVSETDSRLAVSPTAFVAQLRHLRAAGFTAVTAAEVATAMAGQGGPLPARPVVLTFDDGYADFHQRVLPLLARHRLTATLFVTTGWTRDAGMRSDAPGRMLDWAQIAEAAAVGVEIAAHTRWHPQLDRLPQQQVREELCTSKQWLEEKLGLPVPGLAYPFGYSSARVREQAREAGYGYAYAVDNKITSTGSDLFQLPRLTVRRGTTMTAFRRMVDGRSTTGLLEDRALSTGWAGVRRVKGLLAA